MSQSLDVAYCSAELDSHVGLSFDFQYVFVYLSSFVGPVLLNLEFQSVYSADDLSTPRQPLGLSIQCCEFERPCLLLFYYR